jgi:hypothetical protein
MQVVMEDGKTLVIDSVINRLEKEEMLELMCRELVNS